jgi:hypothetical protein
LNPVVVTVAGGGGLGINDDSGGPGVDLDGKGNNKPSKPRSISQRLKNLGKQLTRRGGVTRGIKGLGKSLLKGVSKIGRGNAIMSLAMGGMEAMDNFQSGQGLGESLGRTALSAGGSLLGGAIGSLGGPVGTFAGGVGGGMAGDALGDYFFGERPTQEVPDGIATSGGPFQIRNKYGQTAITAAGDKLAVSPNISNSSPMDLTPMIAAINQVTAAVNRLEQKSWNVNLDSKAVGTGLMQKSYRSA